MLNIPKKIDDATRYYVAEPPPPGGMVEIATGIFWLRLALPLKLDHVNVYVLDDGDGWCVIDAGLDDERTRADWEAALSGPLAAKPVTRILVTHYHPDHIGAAGWLAQRCGANLLIAQTEYLLARLRIAGIFNDTAAFDTAFYRARGLSEEAIQGLADRGPEYQRTVHALPLSYERLEAGATLQIGGRNWQILTGGGHSEEQVMLWCDEDDIFISVDQVLPGITPNIGVWPVEPNARPLDHFMNSLHALKDMISDSVLVLPGHKLPFHGLHRRIDELVAHHLQFCDRIVEACRGEPITVGAMVPKLFRRELNGHHTALAFSETLAHVNTLIHTGRLTQERGPDGLFRVVS